MPRAKGSWLTRKIPKNSAPVGIPGFEAGEGVITRFFSSGIKRENWRKNCSLERRGGGRKIPCICSREWRSNKSSLGGSSQCWKKVGERLAPYRDKRKKNETWFRRMDSEGNFKVETLPFLENRMKRMYRSISMEEKVYERKESFGESTKTESQDSWDSR